jgi:serine/threonine-protein kinase
MSEDTPTAPGRLGVGSRLAGYRCEEEIGHGGMAVVYRAHDDHLDRRVALKVLTPELARDEVFRARFIQESRIAAATEHPHIIPVFNAGEADGMLYIAMRYVADGDVRTLIDRVGPLPVTRACALIAQVASALDAAHARGLVHRDVKPTNMLLELSKTSRPDHLYLSDFGLAKPSSAATGLTMTGQFFGTVDYVAPEQIQGQPLDGRTDQYALACASFEMLCGSPPFKRENGMAVISAQLSEPPPSLSARRPELPPAVDQVIAKALAKSPADRYDHCLDFAEALLAAYRSGPAGAGRTQPAAPHPPTRMAMPAAPATMADEPPTIDPVISPAAAGGRGAAGGGMGAAAGLGAAAGAAFASPGPPGGAAGAAGAGGTAGAGGAAGAAGAAAGPPGGRPGDPSIVPGFPPAPPPPAGGWQPADWLPAVQPGPTARQSYGADLPPADPWAGQQWSTAGQGGPGGPRRRRSRAGVALTVAAILIVVFLVAAGVSYYLLSKNANSNSPGAGGSPSGGGHSAPASTGGSPATSPSDTASAANSSTPPPPATPASTVQAYYTAINNHHYHQAWELGGKNTGSTYSSFVNGFAGTAQDTVTIQSVSGNTVNAQLSAQQTDGTVKTYQGTYTVTNGVITVFNVQQTS